MCQVAEQTKEWMSASYEEVLKELGGLDEEGKTEYLDELAIKDTRKRYLYSLFDYIGSDSRQEIQRGEYGIFEAFTDSEKDRIDAAVFRGDCTKERLEGFIVHKIKTRKRTFVDKITMMAEPKIL